ncbi:MAG: alpha-L-rhamnosidase N-terminal domain-containing protein, partial [Opitutaceae bacterium]|nr:alpha-L-rhamnosidase N-terminal domain-containing protein [Opitutaceae bacterium]
MRAWLACLLLGSGMTVRGWTAPSLRVVHTLCESAVDPRGVDSTAPRLSWSLVGTGRAEGQNAWQVQAASTREQLSEGRPDLWDSGKVSGSESLHIPYQGAALTSSQTVYWQVRVWNERNEATAWSDPAEWTMGLLSTADWKADWIRSPSPGPNPLFRRSLRARSGLVRAWAHVCGLGHYELRINGRKVGEDVLSPG